MSAPSSSIPFFRDTDCSGIKLEKLWLQVLSCLFCRLAYLHEGLEPKVVHRDVKSSNILLDKKWNPKVSDFGLAKLLGSEASYVTTRVMGTFGFVFFHYLMSICFSRWELHIYMCVYAVMFHQNMQAQAC